MEQQGFFVSIKIKCTQLNGFEQQYQYTQWGKESKRNEVKGQVSDSSLDVVGVGCSGSSTE